MLKPWFALIPLTLAACSGAKEPGSDAPIDANAPKGQMVETASVNSPSDEGAAGDAAPEPAERPSEPVEVSIELPDSDAVEFDFELDPAITRFDPRLAKSLADRGVSEAVKFAREASSEKAMDPEYFREWRFSRQWRLVASSGDLGVVEQTDAVDAGGAHPNFFTESAIYQRGGDVLPIGALFSDDAAAEKRLKGLFRERLLAARKSRAGEFMNDEDLAAGIDAALTEDFFVNFPMAPVASSEADRLGGLVVHVNPYVVGPYAEGSYDIVLDQSDFRDLLRPAYRDVFTGQPDVREE